MAADEQRRAAQRASNELDYWRAVLEELNAINDLAPAIALELVQAAPPLVRLAFTGGAAGDAGALIGERVLAAMQRVNELGPILARLLELADGRQKMLRDQWAVDYPDSTLGEPPT